MVLNLAKHCSKVSHDGYGSDEVRQQSFAQTLLIHARTNFLAFLALSGGTVLYEALMECQCARATRAFL